MNTLLHEDRSTRKEGDLMRQGVTVDVTPVFDDGTVCEIVAGDGPSHAFVHGGIINLHGNSEFEVTWNLQPGDSPGLAFDSKDPIWSSQEGCPGGSCNDPQFTVESCGGTKLVTKVKPAKPKNAVHVSLGWSNGKRFDPIVINNSI